MISCAQICHRPAFIPKTKPNNAAAKKGLAFQRKITKEICSLGLGRVFAEPWFVYKLRSVLRYCSPDIIIEQPNRIIVVEIKLTWQPEIDNKLRNLYTPIAKHVFRKPVKAVLVVRNVSPGAPLPDDLEGALRSPSTFSLAQAFV